MTPAGKRLLEHGDDFDCHWRDIRSDVVYALVQVEAEAVAAERARIRAAVEGLRTDWGQRITSMGPETVSVSMVDAVDRAAVLAAINGIPPTTITDLPDIGTGYPEEADHA